VINHFKYILIFLVISFCSTSTSPSLPENFNNCLISLDESLEDIQQIKNENEINFEIRIVREPTEREECVDMILGTNLEQGSRIDNGDVVDLVVGIKKDEITETVLDTEYDLYLQQLEDKNIEELNLIIAPNFGTSIPNIIIEDQNVVTFIRKENPLNYKFMFSEAEGYVYGVDSDNKVNMVLDISDKTVREREAGLHTFDFLNIDATNYLIITYSGTDNNYHLSAFEILDNLQLGEEQTLALLGDIDGKTVHLGGKILQKNDDIILCLGDVNSPGTSAKFDTLWGKIISFPKINLLKQPVTTFNDERISFIGYGLRNPWSCFFQENNLIIPDVGNSHWEEINIIKNLDINNEPVFFGWPWYEAYFNANYNNTPVDEETKNSLIEQAKFPLFLYPHANNYCAIIGGTELKDTSKWEGYFFVGDFCTGTIWAINIENQSELIVLEKNLIPFSITTINDSGNETLLVGTTSGQIIEVVLP
tara:strand:+ start:13855 stop:15288 length:1434 start_codon:yes stop_codon:yes gene_type:complete